MKHLIAFIALVAVTLSATAQISGKKTMYGSNSASIDTVTGTATEYLTTAADDLNRYADGVYDIEVNLSNDSATSGGYIVLQSSNDRTNWSNHFGTVGTDGMNCDSLAFTGDLHHIFHVEPNAVKYDALGVPSNSKSGRRLNFRVKIDHTGNGKTSYWGTTTTANR